MLARCAARSNRRDLFRLGGLVLGRPDLRPPLSARPLGAREAPPPGRGARSCHPRLPARRPAASLGPRSTSSPTAPAEGPPGPFQARRHQTSPAVRICEQPCRAWCGLADRYALVRSVSYNNHKPHAHDLLHTSPGPATTRGARRGQDVRPAAAGGLSRTSAR